MLWVLNSNLGVSKPFPMGTAASTICCWNGLGHSTVLAESSQTSLSSLPLHSSAELMIFKRNVVSSCVLEDVVVNGSFSTIPTMDKSPGYTYSVFGSLLCSRRLEGLNFFPILVVLHCLKLIEYCLESLKAGF